MTKNNGDKGTENSTALLDTANDTDINLDEVFDAFQNIPALDSMSTAQKLGVMQRLVTAVGKGDSIERRQILLLAAFDDKHEALLAADAITERLRYGVDVDPILDRVIAQCATKSARVDKVLNATNSYNFNTNYPGKLPFWKKRQEDKSLT